MAHHQFLGQIKARLERDEHVFVALVVDHTKHSPGTRGAWLLLSKDGQQIGTIGGGIMEHDLLTQGLAALKTQTCHDVADFEPRLQALYHRREAPGERSGLICAGRQTNVSFILSKKRDLAAVLHAIDLVEHDDVGTLCFTPDGGLSIDLKTTPEAGVAIVEMSDTWQLQLDLLARDRVVIFGGGHCGLALSKQLALLDFTVSICDVRPQLPTLMDNDFVRYKHVVPSYEQAATQIKHPALTHAVIMTADFPSDVLAIEGALQHPFPFIGVMGAPAKRIAIMKALRAKGITKESLTRLTMPVGLPIASSTPAEIAVSVAAQLVQLKTQLSPHRQPSAMT